MAELTYEHYKNALAFATKKHKGQFRIGGSDYIYHPIAVAKIVEDLGYGFEYRITALFHDLLEDTDATYDEILSLSNKDVADAVVLLTKQKGYDMNEYISKIKKNEIAFVVKTADRFHNLSSAFVADDAFKRKYILETIDWYWDFSPEIREVTKKLAKTLNKPMTDFPFLYDSDISFKL